jgi:hypothetical protein
LLPERPLSSRGFDSFLKIIGREKRFDVLPAKAIHLDRGLADLEFRLAGIGFRLTKIIHELSQHLSQRGDDGDGSIPPKA